MANDGTAKGLEFSIPANNQKIIEIYNKLRSGQLGVNKDYQRKLVWKRSHKLNFIDTILRNYPFPEIYFAPGALDQVKLILIDEIVDGQQRLTTIRDYIEGTDVFALPNISIKKFSELTPEEKTMFLNYEISVRYLKNANQEQVREIFQRINKTDYALNATERINAQWGDSEFVCFAKQLIEPDFDSDSIQFKIDQELKKKFVCFFHGKDDEEEGVFSANDVSRMLALQYIMSVVATMDCQGYFVRNEKLQSYIAGYNESFPQAADLIERLSNVVDFIQGLQIRRDSRWYNKANLFTLFVELDKIDLSTIDSAKFSKVLSSFDLRATMDEIGMLEGDEKLTADEVKYLGLAREAVNEKTAREFRGEFMQRLIKKSAK
ncbi:MAG: DUF262 domain-containing protein [Gallionella sp.]|nr:DUF262 domain-containing protein [Gallionella sp.]